MDCHRWDRSGEGMISIVMPVYNTGKYLEESLQSILMQSYGDFELICVDDCSNDILTKEILSKYEKQDDRIKVLAMECNFGAAEARNIGLTYAKGEYITFLDADDIFHKDMLMNAYNTITKHNADMCIWGYRVFSVNDGKKITLSETYPKLTGNKTDEVFNLVDLSEDGLIFCRTAPWNKLCRRSLLVNNNIRFQTLKCSNDVYYSIMCAICAKKIVCVEGEGVLVEYRIGNGNQISSNRDPRCLCDAVEAVLKKCIMNKYLTRQLAYAFIKMMRYEFESSINESWKEESYYRWRDLINKNFSDVEFDDVAYNILKRVIAEIDYNHGKSFLLRNFEGQIKGYIDELISEIGVVEELVVWGKGRRGQALFGLVDLLDCRKVMVVDSSNNDVGTYIDNRIPIVHTDDIKGKKCTIIATNTNVYNYIRNMDICRDIKVINLERYCPVG